MNAAQVNFNPLPASEAGLVAPEQALSALVDGELDVAGFDAMLAAGSDPADTLANWHSYQLIGDVLRGAGPMSTVRSPTDFLVGVRARLQAEAVHWDAPGDRAHVAVPLPQALPARAPAANEALFRWKLVAGFASLAAVMAVSWGVLSGAPSGVGGSTPQLAATVPTAEPATTVVVNTGQGALIRDARLEELLAEHRQNGGMSALQMPTGFIRNATYDAAGR